MMDIDFETLTQEGGDLHVRPTRHAIVIEFPCDLDEAVVTSLLEHVAVYAEDIITTRNGRVIGTYEEDYA